MPCHWHKTLISNILKLVGNLLTLQYENNNPQYA